MNWADRKDMLKSSEEVLRLKHGPGFEGCVALCSPALPHLSFTGSMVKRCKP